MVSDTHLVVRQPVDGEILPELPVAEVASPEVVLPIPIGVRLIHQYGPAFAAVASEVTLSVAVYIEPTHHARAFNRRLPNAGMNRLALPSDVTRQAHIHGEQVSHQVSHDDHRNWR